MYLNYLNSLVYYSVTEWGGVWCLVSLCIFILKEISCKHSNMFYIGCYFSNGLERRRRGGDFKYQRIGELMWYYGIGGKMLSEIILIYHFWTKYVSSFLSMYSSCVLLNWNSLFVCIPDHKLKPPWPIFLKFWLWNSVEPRECC